MALVGEIALVGDKALVGDTALVGDLSYYQVSYNSVPLLCGGLKLC